MNAHQREQLERRLAELPKAERDRLYRLGQQLRAEDQKRKRISTSRQARAGLNEDFEPGSFGGRAPGNLRRDPVRDYVLKVLAREEAERAAAAVDESREPAGRASAPALSPALSPAVVVAESAEGVERPADVVTGTVVHVGRRRCKVREDGRSDEGADVTARLPAELAGQQQAGLCVGDRVTIARRTAGAPGSAEEERDDRAAAGFDLVQVLRRRTVLARRDPRTGERRTIVANVDAVCVVVSVVTPPLHPRLIDRYLIALEDSHAGEEGGEAEAAGAILCVNKIDLLEGLPAAEREAELARLDPYRALGIPVVECAAARSHGLDRLRELIAGKTVAFVGHSGVGKSSLTNALDARIGAKVGQTSDSTSKGRHTTTTAQLYDVPNGERAGIRVIDTPGVRSFALDEMTPAELRDAFAEFRALRRAGHTCRFNDCTHTHEPGCAVREAVERGEVSAARFETYQRMLADITGDFPESMRVQRIRPVMPPPPSRKPE